MSERVYDAIVIGAGFGGASCAGLLAKQGLDVLLLERYGRAGGKARSLSRKGFQHSAWVVIGAPVIGNLYEHLLEALRDARRAFEKPSELDSRLLEYRLGPREIEAFARLSSGA